MTGKKTSNDLRKIKNENLSHTWKSKSYCSLNGIHTVKDYTNLKTSKNIFYWNPQLSYCEHFLTGVALLNPISNTQYWLAI